MEIAQDTKKRTSILMEVESTLSSPFMERFVLYDGGLLEPVGGFLPGRGNQVWWESRAEDKENSGYKHTVLLTTRVSKAARAGKHLRTLP